MACYIYDPLYFKVMRIAVYNMQSEDTKVECIVEKKGSNMHVFKRFMVDGV
jgi:hypothetical protein